MVIRIMLHRAHRGMDLPRNSAQSLNPLQPVEQFIIDMSELSWKIGRRPSALVFSAWHTLQEQDMERLRKPLEGRVECVLFTQRLHPCVVCCSCRGTFVWNANFSKDSQSLAPPAVSLSTQGRRLACLESIAA